MGLIDPDLAARHLKVSTAIPEIAAELGPKIDQATAIVIHYIKRPDHGWTMQTDPTADYEFAIVQAAILKVLANLWAFRGDDQQASSPLSTDVVALLSMVRDPSLA